MRKIISFMHISPDGFLAGKQIMNIFGIDNNFKLYENYSFITIIFISSCENKKEIEHVVAISVARCDGEASAQVTISLIPLLKNHIPFEA